MRASVILPLLLLVALTAAACGATPVLAGAATSPRQTVTPRTGTPRTVSSRTVTPREGGRAGSLAVGATVDTSPVRLLFVGASVTEGWFASTRDRAYPALVAKGMADGRRVRIETLARPGITAEEAGHDWALTTPSDVIVVQIATNDFVRDVPVDVYQAAYTGVLDRLRVASPKAELVCLGAWLDPSARNRLGLTAAQYDVAARTACESNAGRYVDISAAFMDARNHGPVGRPTYDGPGDLFHPNDRGHAAIASLILQAEGITAAPAPAT